MMSVCNVNEEGGVGRTPRSTSGHSENYLDMLAYSFYIVLASKV